MRVQLVDGEYRVVLSAEAMEALKLRDGDGVEVRPVSVAEIASRYVSAEEAIASYLKTEPLHRKAYEELAK